MKFYLMNKDEVKKNIFKNPILLRTKSLAKIVKFRKLQKQLDLLKKQIVTELKSSNAAINDEIISNFLVDCGDEITRQEYNSLLVMCLMDTQEQRISCCNKSQILKGKLWGTEIR